MRAAGGTPGMTENQQRIVDGRAWSAFCGALKSTGDILLREGTPATPFDRAEGIRYLTRLLRAGLERQLEHARPALPGLLPALERDDQDRQRQPGQRLLERARSAAATTTASAARAATRPLRQLRHQGRRLREGRHDGRRPASSTRTSSRVDADGTLRDPRLVQAAAGQLAADETRDDGA